MTGALSWVFEGSKADRGKKPTMIQLNLHSFEREATGAVVVVNTELHHVTATFSGPRALSEGHRCMAAVLDAIAERSDEAHPEAFSVDHRGPVFLAKHKSVTVFLEGRVSDVVVAFATYFGSTLADNARIKRLVGTVSAS